MDFYQFIESQNIGIAKIGSNYQGEYTDAVSEVSWTSYGALHMWKYGMRFLRAASLVCSKPDSFWNICKQLHVKRLSIRRKKTRKLWKRWRPPGTSFDEERWVRYDSQCFVCICLVCFIWMLQRMPWAKNGWFYDSSLVTGYQGPVWFLYYQISAPTHSSSEVWWKQVEHEQKEMCSYLAYIWADIVTPCTYPHFLKNT